MSPANRKIFMAGSLNLIDFGALDILICACVCVLNGKNREMKEGFILNKTGEMLTCQVYTPKRPACPIL